jgi:hypothetical protein
MLRKIALPGRANTALVVVPGSDEMTLRQVRDARTRAEAAAKEAGLKGVTVDYPGGAAGDAKPDGERQAPALEKPSAKTNLPAAPVHMKGTYYLGGHVARPGAYSMSERGVRLRQALISAGLLEGRPPDEEIQLIRRSGEGEEYFRLRLDEVMEAGSPNGSAPLHDGDQLLVGKRSKPAEN